MSRRGAERDGDTESEAGSRLRAVSTEPGTGLKLKSHEIMSQSRTLNRLSHPAAPLTLFIYFERGRDSMSWGRAEREGVPSRLCSVILEPDARLKLTRL